MATLPDDKALAKILTSMLRRTVEVKVSKPAPDGELIATGHYVNGAKAVVAGCFADKAMVCFSGAAFSLVPAEAAKDALKDKELDEILQENFEEVLNICSRLFDAGSETRVTLTVKEFSAGSRSEKSIELLGKPAKRSDYEVTIDGYGKGRMTLVLA